MIFISDSNIEETEETFELAKQIILNNENMRSKIIFKRNNRTFFDILF